VEGNNNSSDGSRKPNDTLAGETQDTKEHATDKSLPSSPNGNTSIPPMLVAKSAEPSWRRFVDSYLRCAEYCPSFLFRSVVKWTDLFALFTLFACGRHAAQRTFYFLLSHKEI